jgi:hypothetical protein
MLNYVVSLKNKYIYKIITLNSDPIVWNAPNKYFNHFFLEKTLGFKKQLLQIPS